MKRDENDWTDDAGRRLRDVLSREARTMHPSADALARIQARINERRASRPWLRIFTVGAAAMATAAVAVIAVTVIPSNGSHDDGGRQVAVSPTDITGAPSPTTSPSPSGVQQPADDGHQVAIYYVGKKADPQQRLYYEMFNRPVPPDKTFVGDAVEALLTTPPTDPDYVSYWPKNTTILGVTIHNDTQVVLDLSADAATAQPGSADNAAISIQQLLYTIHAAAPKIESLELRIDGTQVTSLWGSSITEPISLAEPASVLSPVWISYPANGATVATTFKFGGEASIFEANVSWRILMNGGVLKTGYSMADKGAPERGLWEASVMLQPGTYTIEAYEVSAKDGSATYVDSKVVTVK